MNIHFLRPGAGEMEMLAGAGFRWIRMRFPWDPPSPNRAATILLLTTASWPKWNVTACAVLWILDYRNRRYDDGLFPLSDEAAARLLGGRPPRPPIFGGTASCGKCSTSPTARSGSHG